MTIPRPHPPRRPARHLALHLAARAALLASLPALALLLATPAQAQPRPTPTTFPAAPAAPESPDPLEGRIIERVEPIGNTRTDARVLLNQVRAQAGQRYSRAQVDLDIRSIAALGLFSTVRADLVPTANDRVIVRYIVTERAVITAVEIKGNENGPDDELRELITARSGGPVDPFVIRSDITAVQHYYANKGYPFTKVALDQAALDKNGLLRYVVTEGPHTRIWTVDFVGNDSLKASYLSWKIKTKSYIWIFRKGVLSEDDLVSDDLTLKDVYIGKGFIDVRVSHTVTYNEDKSRAYVNFTIVEGPQYRVGKINITVTSEPGVKAAFPEPELRDDIILHPGDTIDREKAEASQRHLEDRYGHAGFIYRTIDLRTSYTGEIGVADLNVTITEGHAFAVERIIVRGNPNIEDRVIRRQVRIYPEQTYDTVLVRKSIERLKATRLFGDVKITPIGNAPDSRDALVEVQEGQTGRFLIGAGISTNAGLIGQVSLEQQNFDWSNYPKSFGEFFRGQSFKGAGQYFRILLEPGTQLQRYRITFEEPYLFDTPYSFANDFYYFTRTRESWDERRLGDIVTFGRRFGDVWSVTLAFRAEDVIIANTHDYGNPGGYSAVINPDGTTGQLGNTTAEIVDQQGSHFLTSIKPAVVRDTTDSRIFPTTGTRTALALEQYGALGGAVDMTKVTTTFNWYYPLYSDLFDRKTVFAQRNELGFIPVGNSPFYERFYAGGIGSLRGFRFRGVSPRGNFDQNVLKDPLGGDFSWLSTGEVNYPIYEELLRGVVFVDVGTVEPDIQLGTIRSDVGFGFRLTIPFFGQLPLAIDFAVPTTQSKKDNDRTQIISFSLGIPF